MQHTDGQHRIIAELIAKGVDIPCPQTVEIGPEVDLARISHRGVKLHAGTKLMGRRTLILDNVRLGYQGPVTVENCLLGPDVRLEGGFFKEAVFLAHASMQTGAHVREGTILEEYARAAHCVALKHTILFPYVTLGSLINFCDCFMSGGTSARDHSEVGSSYVHFNFTPNQDKATPSLMGDVPRGVMIRQPPIFLGGQGGMVGPRRLAFGTVIGAGTIYRRDVLQPQRLLIGGNDTFRNLPYERGSFRNVRRTLANNSFYVANLIALRHWYVHVRTCFVRTAFPDVLLQGLIQNIDLAIDERIRRLQDYCTMVAASVLDSPPEKEGPLSAAALNLRRSLARKGPALADVLNSQCNAAGQVELRDRFLGLLEKTISRQGRDYLAVIQGLEAPQAAAGTQWLKTIVAQVTGAVGRLLPGLHLEETER